VTRRSLRRVVALGHQINSAEVAPHLSVSSGDK
jgi:hypothetical protein